MPSACQAAVTSPSRDRKGAVADPTRPDGHRDEGTVTDPSTESIALRPIEEPTMWDAELARYEGRDSDPPYEGYGVVGTGTFH